MVEIRVLGPLEVLADGRTLDLGSRKQKTVLALLAANAGRPVLVDHCLQAVWGEDAPEGAVRSLHTYISNLRSIIDSERTGIIEGLGGSYRLNLPESATVDWILFEELRGSDDLADIEKALGLWRGRPFQDVEDEWAAQLVREWEQDRLAAWEAWADAMLDLGETAALIPKLEQLVEEHPLHEPLQMRLILSLYRAGRQADSLAVAKTLRDRLVEELGIEPSPEMQELEDRILTQDPSLLPRPTTPTNLPSALTATIGRVNEHETLVTLLHSTRLLTIIGAGGVGKTIAARDVAQIVLDEFPDGVWWFELAPLTDPSLLLGQMLGAMRLPPPTSQDPLQYLSDRLSGSRALLVFDNCEHLIGPVASVVNAVLSAGESVKVMATSREPLTVSGELAWSLPPMSVPDRDSSTADEVVATDAGALFATRAKQANPEFQVTDDNASRIASICRRLDGLPFALELAAARLRSMGLGELEGRLDDRFSLLTGGSRAEVSHHQTLRGTVEWSYDLLPAETQPFYADLSVFRGGFELEAAEAVSSSENTIDLLDSLVSHSMLIADTLGDTVRYRMLETVREHAEELLRGSSREDAVRRAHLTWVAELVREGARRLEGKEGPVWMAKFRRESDNTRSALAYAAAKDPVTGAAICGGLSRFWFSYAADQDVTTLDDATSFLEEGRRWSQMMLDAEEELPPKIRARLLTALGGLLLIRLGRFDEAIGHLREARRLWEELGDVRNQAWAFFYEGAASWSLVPIEETISFFERSNALHEQADDPFGSLTSKLMRGLAFAVSNDLESAGNDLGAFHRGAYQIGAAWLTAHADDALAVQAILAGSSFEEVAIRAGTAIESFRRIPNYACLCHAVQTAAMSLSSQGRLEEAARCLGVALSIRDRLGMVIAPYEDRTFWVEDLGLGQLDTDLRLSAIEEGQSMRPDEGVDWVLETIGARTATTNS